MKICALCGFENETSAVTCAACGEATWIYPERQLVVPKRGTERVIVETVGVEVTDDSRQLEAASEAQEKPKKSR